MAADDRLIRSATPTGTAPDELARRLRDAHRRVRALDAPREDKERFFRRFLAICDLAKRDLNHAAGRLDLLLAEISALQSASSDRSPPPSAPPQAPENDTPSERNMAQGD
ncbi:hypothetical protein [Sinosporangium siamense]|uniref:Uncharacterized protein n=1 Tax=Sinosporangium siamense TaxID=1367973 RepID=A0A919RIL7_9ACTN|nr:hypothetical protein [Sinosporangium siamense]GII92666.1 hypothetical protein Ssi02_28970 [Sinosporangium siamense]